MAGGFSHDGVVIVLAGIVVQLVTVAKVEGILDLRGDINVAGHFERCAAGCVLAIEEVGIQGQEEGCDGAHALLDSLRMVSEYSNEVAEEGRNLQHAMANLLRH